MVDKNKESAPVVGNDSKDADAPKDSSKEQVSTQLPAPAQNAEDTVNTDSAQKTTQKTTQKTAPDTTQEVETGSSSHGSEPVTQQPNSEPSNTDIDDDSVDPEHKTVIHDVAPKRTRVFGDLLHAGFALLGGVGIVFVAIYLQGLTQGVESDAHSAGRVIDWLMDVPANLLQQLAVLVIVLMVLFQLLTHKKWLQTAYSIGALVIGFGGAWLTSYIISITGNHTLINALTSNGTEVGVSLLPDFYAAIAAFLTVAGPRRMSNTVKWAWNIIIGTAIILIIGSWNGVAAVVVSFCIGRLLGLLIRFGVGTPNNGAWGMQVVQALRHIGLEPTLLERRHVSLDTESNVLSFSLDDDLVENSRIYNMTDADGSSYTVSVLDNQTHSAGYLNQLWQTVRLSGVTIRHDRSAFDAMHHHLSMLLGLDHMQLPTMQVYGVCDSGESSILVFDKHPLPEADEITTMSDEDIKSLYTYLQTAHLHGYTHRKISIYTLAHLENGKRYIAGWQNGDCASSSANKSLDKVQLLTLMATLFGVKRSINLAREVWGDEMLIRIVPFLQKVAVPASTRSLDGWDKQLLETMRKEINSFTPTEASDTVEKVNISRFSAKSFFGIAMMVIAVSVIVTQLKPEEMAKAIKDANIWFALIVFVFSLTAHAGSAITLGGFMRPEKRKSLDLYLCQMAAGYAAVSLPAGVGPAYVNLRFLRKNGYKTTTATAIMSATWALQALVTAVLLIGIGVFSGSNSLHRMIPSNTLILVVAAVALVISLMMAIPPIRHKIMQQVMPLVKSYARSFLEILTQPKECAIGILGALVLNLSTGFGFWAALMAFGYQSNPIQTTFVFLLANTLGSAVPTPGGLGAVEAALSVTFTAVGVPSAVALSATLLYRICFYWLRIPMGAVAMKWLEKHNLI